MAIVRLKTKDEKVNELLGMFKLPGTDYQSHVKPSVVGGSAANNNNNINNVEQQRLHAVNQLRKWTRLG